MAHGDRDLGDLILQPTSIGGDFDGVQYASFVDSMCDISDGNNKPEDKLIWPLMSSLRGSNAANIAIGDNGMQENPEYETDNVVGRDSKDGCVFMSSKCFLDLGEDGPLANSFYVFRHTTEKISYHTQSYTCGCTNIPVIVMDVSAGLKWAVTVFPSAPRAYTTTRNAL